MNDKSKKGTCCSSAERKKARTEEEKRALINRINRIEGQVKAIKRMIEEDAYCPDVLIQISAGSAALSALSRIMLAEHIKTCVMDDIRKGDSEAAEELAQLVERLSRSNAI